ncbi:MAG: hypothetical protein AB7F65_06835 [Dehalococcoidia bacterium]
MTLIPQEQPQERDPRRPWIVLFAVIVSVGLNTVAAVVGAQAGQERAPTLADPAEYAFGIWGVVFVTNVVFALYQATPSQRTDPLLDRVAVPFVVGQLFGALFAVASLADSNALGQLSTALYFAAAVATYLMLGVGRRDDGWGRRAAAWLPASMSAAWLLAATIAVLAGFLQNGLEVSPPFGGGEDWAAVAVGSTAIVAAALLVWRRDFVFAAVTAWALVAIAQEQTNEVVDTAVVASVAALGLVALGMVPKATAELPWRRSRRERPLNAR